MSENITYYGIDLSDSYCQLSFFGDDMAEPVSISMVVGSEKYLIPTVIGRPDKPSSWRIGEEALTMPVQIHNLLSRAMKREEIQVEDEEFEAMKLLEIFIRRLLYILGTSAPHKGDERYVFSIPHTSQLAVETILEIAGEMGLDKEKVKICSRQECFCYYVMNQEPAVRIHDVLLFDYWKETFKVYHLQQNKSVEPSVISVGETELLQMSRVTEDVQKDRKLYDAMDEILSKGIISSIYLVGDGFDGDWLKQSLSRMCAGRRVFAGKNLYTKGACYYGKVSGHIGKRNTEYLYLGGGNILSNVCIRGRNNKEYGYKVLIPAGYNWQEANGTLDIIVRQEDIDSKVTEAVIDVLIRSLKGEEKREQMVLAGLQICGAVPHRLRIIGQAVSTTKVKIFVEDLGFGQLCNPGNKKWEFEFRV